jgi:glycosyltransferase involved in cell wall biosynthesis
MEMCTWNRGSSLASGSGIRPLRVYTCTPVAFEGDDRFFTRESGCFSRGLTLLGVESMPIMPEPAWKTDRSDLLRVPYNRLEDPEFWRSLRLDGLILYSWAAPRYVRIARAVQKAGIPFLVNVDSCGLVSRPANPLLWWRDLLPYLWHKAVSPLEMARFVSRVVDNCGIYRIARGRLHSHEAATVVGGVSPLTAQWLRNEAVYFGRNDLAPKIRYLPHPQMSIFSYDGQRKENLVVSVARWEKNDDTQKNPHALLDALDVFLESHTDWRACIIGTGASSLAARVGRLHLKSLTRCEFIDFIKPDKLVPLFCKAKIGFWSSRSEGQIGAGAQALCCGCSVVAGNSGTLSCFHHYVSRESGRLALGMQAMCLAEALALEADAWLRLERDPQRISRIWCEEFHEKAVAKRGLQLLGLMASD